MLQHSLFKTHFYDPDGGAPDKAYDDQKICSKIENDLIFAINCLSASGEYEQLAAEVRRIILLENGINWLVQALSDLYADVGLFNAGQSSAYVCSQAVAEKIAKAVELVKTCRDGRNTGVLKHESKQGE